MTTVEPVPGRPGALPPAPPGWEHAGGAIVRASLVGTAIFTVTSVAGAIAPDVFRYVAATTSLVLFALGCVIFAWSYALAVARSRTDEIGIGGLYFLVGPTAPVVVRRRLMGLFAIEVVVALVAAGVRPFTPLAFGTLVPIYGLALAGLWGARHGRFGPRVAPSRAARVAAATAAGAKAPAAGSGAARGTTPTSKTPTKPAGATAAKRPVRPPPAGVDQNAAPITPRRRGTDRPRPRTTEEGNPHGRTGDAADHR